MDISEFRELAFQSLPSQKRGRTTRFTLVRTSGDFFINKIHNQDYFNIRSIPIEKNYRFIISSFTHEEYQNFKDDFWQDVDFLKIPREDFEYLPELAILAGYNFDEFKASGRGRIDLRAPNSEKGSDQLLKDMAENTKRGMKPYHLTFSVAGKAVSVRSDLNFFLTAHERTSVDLIYRITEYVLSRNKADFDSYASLKIAPKASEREFMDIRTVSFAIPLEKKESFLRNLSEWFIIGKLDNPSETESVYLYEKNQDLPTFRINFESGRIVLVPTTTSKVESVINLKEALLAEVE